jgi:hypothetical protein
MAILQRPARQADITACWRALVRAWEAEGIPRGGYFEVRPHEDGDMNRLKFDKDSATSRNAAIYNYPRRDSQRKRILEAVLAAREYGMTSDEAEAQLAISHQTCSARMNDLREGGFITCQKVDGEKITRKTRSNAEAEVMIATQKAIDATAASHVL